MGRPPVVHGRRSAPCGWTAGKMSAFEPAWHGAHYAARGAPGRAACCAPHPRVARDPRSLSEIRFSAWAFSRGGGAAADCGALRPPHLCPCWQSVVAAPLSGLLPRIPGPLDKPSSTIFEIPDPILKFHAPILKFHRGCRRDSQDALRCAPLPGDPSSPRH